MHHRFLLLLTSVLVSMGRMNSNSPLLRLQMDEDGPRRSPQRLRAPHHWGNLIGAVRTRFSLPSTDYPTLTMHANGRTIVSLAQLHHLRKDSHISVKVSQATNVSSEAFANDGTWTVDMLSGDASWLKRLRQRVEGPGALENNAEGTAQRIWMQARTAYAKGQLQAAAQLAAGLVALGNSTRLPDAYHLMALSRASHEDTGASYREANLYAAQAAMAAVHR